MVDILVGSLLLFWVPHLIIGNSSLASSGRGHTVNFLYLHDGDQDSGVAKSIIHLLANRKDEEGGGGRGLCKYNASCVSSREREKSGRRKGKKGGVKYAERERERERERDESGVD